MYELLPMDILTLIVNLVPIYSRWAFTQTCKRWRAARKVLSRRERVFATAKTTDGLRLPTPRCSEMWWNEYVYWVTKYSIPFPIEENLPIEVVIYRIVAQASQDPNVPVTVATRISVLLKVGDIEALEPWIGAIPHNQQVLMDFIPTGTAMAVWDMIMTSPNITPEQKRNLILTIPVAFPEVLKKYLPVLNYDGPVRLNRTTQVYTYKTRKADTRHGVDLIMQDRKVVLDGLNDVECVNFVVLGRIIVNSVARGEYVNIITIAALLKNHASIYDELSPQAADIYMLLVSICHGGLDRPNYSSDAVCPCEVLNALISYDHMMVVYNGESLIEACLICVGRGHNRDDDFAKLANKTAELDEFCREPVAFSSPPRDEDYGP